MPISLISTQNIDLHEDFENQFKQLIEVVSQHLQKPVLPAPTSIQLAGPSKQAFQVNDKVFAYWWPDEHWYPAHVRQVESERIYIRFTDGTLQWSKRDQVMLSNLETGDRIQCRFKGKDYYYPAKIMQMEGDRLMVQYDFQDGTAEDPAWHEEEWTSFAMVRV